MPVIAKHRNIEWEFEDYNFAGDVYRDSIKVSWSQILICGGRDDTGAGFARSLFDSGAPPWVLDRKLDVRIYEHGVYVLSPNVRRKQ